ncbi:unnamed protein product [Symbiodinium sp. CCMP2592]|nr:unnamed protein product [Symbiodinium sp. CCMP2592]
MHLGHLEFVVMNMPILDRNCCDWATDMKGATLTPPDPTSYRSRLKANASNKFKSSLAKLASPGGSASTVYRGGGSQRDLDAKEARHVLTKVKDEFRMLLRQKLGASQNNKKEPCPKEVFEGLGQMKGKDNGNLSRELVKNVLSKFMHEFTPEAVNKLAGVVVPDQEAELNPPSREEACQESSSWRSRGWDDREYSGWHDSGSWSWRGGWDSGCSDWNWGQSISNRAKNKAEGDGFVEDWGRGWAAASGESTTPANERSLSKSPDWNAQRIMEATSTLQYMRESGECQIAGFTGRQGKAVQVLLCQAAEEARLATIGAIAQELLKPLRTDRDEDNCMQQLQAKAEQLETTAEQLETTVDEEVAAAEAKTTGDQHQVQKQKRLVGEERTAVEEGWKKPRLGACAKCRVRGASTWYSPCGCAIYCSECGDQELNVWAGMCPRCGRRVTEQIPIRWGGFDGDFREVSNGEEPVLSRSNSYVWQQISGLLSS